jgi:hypothetical protein
VLAVFARSAYIEVAGQIAALTAAELDRGPLAIPVDGFEVLRTVWTDEAVTLRAGRLRVGAHEVALDGAPRWDPVLPPAASGAAVHLPRVVRILTRDASRESVASLLDDPQRPTASRYRALLARLREALGTLDGALFGDGRPEAVAAAAAAIAGLGPGLTPSGDDLLVGIMHAVTVWPTLATGAGGPRLRVRIAEAATPRTTRISGAYLRAAAEGWAAEPWHRLVAVLGGEAAGLDAVVAGVLRVGETSGADALTGFCWAWRRLGASISRPGRHRSRRP